MIVTRSWLEEFIDLSDISDQKLYETFNAIGLEVDSMHKITIPQGVVVGKTVTCQKHPDADKLHVCGIDTGNGIKQIVCGAANVVEAEYVAVATVGTVLDENFQIKPAKLRGVDSEGMVCSSTELGLPKINDGIMILDDSIGKLEIGKELNEYPNIADTVIELELTANRGDCLSIHGVARDLSAALERDLKLLKINSEKPAGTAIARRLSFTNDSKMGADLLYKFATNRKQKSSLLVQLRLGFANLEISNTITNVLRYSTHATGVILRAYDTRKLNKNNDAKQFTLKDNGYAVDLYNGDDIISTIGISQSNSSLPDSESKEVIFEASYIEPQKLIEAVANSNIKTDELYYNTSRGSEPDLKLGMHYLQNKCLNRYECALSDCFSSGVEERGEKRIAVSFKELFNIIGQSVERAKVDSILTRLGFKVNITQNSEAFAAIVPRHRHDIENIQDIAEEILRIVGINNIKSKPLTLIETIRLTDATKKFKVKRDIKNRAIAAGFYEAITFAFSDSKKLQKYGFEILDENLKVANPIAEDLDALRSTLLVNLLESAERNYKYGIRRIPLFEIGTVFDSQRDESEKMAFVWSGQYEVESIANSAKTKKIDLYFFVDTISSIFGDLELKPTTNKNALIHPYQSADIYKDGIKIGYLSKLHPSVAKGFSLQDTFFAEFDFDSVMPKHINAKTISNFQGVYKDLSIVIDKDITFEEIKNSINTIKNNLLKRYYPIDTYQDDSLGDKHSLTIRLFIQSNEKTLSDEDIEQLTSEVLDRLKNDFGATLR